jgi:trans-2,3-dihydro-3-hydroxyanthranilate isomerase
MARQLEVHLVDAFSATPLQGNACAVVLDARGLDDAAMQAIARETNQSETSFVFPGDGEADFVVRYWTPIFEIPLAGHPTVATTHALRETGAIAPDRTQIALKMPAAVMPVTIRPHASAVYAMSQPPPVFMRTVPRADIAAGLGLDDADLLEGTTPQTVSTGAPQLMVALASRAALDRCDPDRRALFRRADCEWSSVHCFIRGDGRPGDEEAALVARNFANDGDVPEDPFTGSATGNMAAYCARYGIVRERSYVVHQGAYVQRPGRAEVEVGGEPPDAIGRITVAGSAVTTLRGTLLL